MLTGKFKSIFLSDLSGGMNSRAAPFSIADNQVVRLRNYRYEHSPQPSVRGGLYQLNRESTLASLVNGKRITSIFGFRDAAGAYHAFVTVGTKIFKYNFNETWTEVTGVTLTDDTYVQWKTMNGLAIGVYGATPVKWSGTGAAAALGGTPPDKAWLIETWNSRCWIVETDTPYQLKYSKLGDAENWTDATAGTGAGTIEIGYQDGDKIMGIKAWREVMIIFKRHKIHIFKTSANGQANTNPDGWKIEILTSELGLVSPFTVQEQGDDLVFLSDYGITSLLSVQQNLGDVKRSILSDDISELYTADKSVTTYGSVINPRDSEYWIAVPGTTPAINSTTWVMNFYGTGKRFSYFDGLAAGSVFGLIEESGQVRVWVGDYDGNVYRYGDASVYGDEGVAYAKSLFTKPMVFDSYFMEKEIARLGLAARTADLPSVAVISMMYRFDEDDARQHTFDMDFGVQAGNATYDVSSFDSTARFAAGALLDSERFYRIQRNPPGNRFQALQIEISNDQIGVYYIIKGIQMWVWAPETGAEGHIEQGSGLGTGIGGTGGGGGV